MNDSREKFEAWLQSSPIKPDLRMKGAMYRNQHVESRYIGWRAGRESMRQEAMKAADDQWVKDPHISASDAIKKIEA